MIRISQISKIFGDRLLFDGVNLSIGSKEKIGLIGRNGSGKSTFLKILLGKEPYDEGSIQKSNHLKIQSLEQNLDFSESTIVKQACLGLAENAYGQQWQAESILMGLGFTVADFQRAPSEFSSGMQVRLRLAQALVSEADLLLLDEPTNYLDIISLRWLERFLKDWKGTFILVTHDQTFMEKVSDHVVGIHRGKMRKIAGSPHKLMEQIKREEEIHEKTRQNQERKAEKTKEFIRKFRAGARSAGLVQSRIKSLEKQKIQKKLEKLPEIKFNFKSKPFFGGQILQATNIDFAYEGQLPVIEKFSLTIRPKDRIAVIGANGKGKSTLLRLLVSDLPIQSGKLKCGENVDIGYFSASETRGLNPRNSILSELNSIPGSKEPLVRSVCGALLFTGESVKKKIAKLSGGERSRVGLGKLMLSENNLLVLDEPTNHLDMESCEALMDALAQFEGAVFFVSHDEKMIRSLANRLVVFDRGKVEVIEQTYDQFLSLTGWEEELENHDLSPRLKSKNVEDKAARKQRNKKIRELKKEQVKVEKELTKLEQHQMDNTVLLNQAYAEKHQKNMLDYGEKAKKLHKSIESSYLLLEKLIEEQEALESK